VAKTRSKKPIAKAKPHAAAASSAASSAQARLGRQHGRMSLKAQRADQAQPKARAAPPPSVETRRAAGTGKPELNSVKRQSINAKHAGKVLKPLSNQKDQQSQQKEKNNHAAPVILPSPVPTDGKPRKNQAGMSPRELEHYRELLLAKRRELVGDMSSMEYEALRSTTGSNLSNLPIHMADMGTDNYEQEFTLGLVEKDRQLLREINSALAKIQNGNYGLCEGTGKPISKPRLEAQPWAKYSIDYARELEKGGVRR
jgi:DnaK suppressor protein